MDKLVKNKVKLRHEQIKELSDKAIDIKNRSQSMAVTVQELLEIKNKLVLSISNFEKELLKLAECIPDLDPNELSTYTTDQIKAEELTAELDALYQLNRPAERGGELQVSTGSTTKLPKLELPKFSGDVLKWPEFWDKFESNVHNRPISNVDKLSYLFSVLEGEALDALSGLDITNDNYPTAVNILKRRFGNKITVINAHYDALTVLPVATEDKTRFTLDRIVKHLRILESLGEDTKGNYFCNLVLNKFPDSVVYELNLRTPQEKDITIILETLEKIVTAKETSTSKRASFNPLPSSSTEVLHVKTAVPPQRKRRMDRIKTPQDNKKRKLECAFCKKAHYSDQCLTYKTYAERIKRLRNQCFQCFEIGHRAKDCKAKIVCHHCQGNHNRALCRKKFPRENGKRPNKKPDVTVAVENKPQGEVIKFVDGKDDVSCNLATNMKSYLQTATAQIQHNNKTVPVRLLLDCGSQRSYITSRLAQALNLQPDRDDQLLIYTFGSDRPQETASPSVETTLVTKRGCMRLLRVNIVPHITDRVQVTQLKPSEDVDIPADDDSLGEKIDMLIGNDYYFSILRNNHLRVGQNLFLVDSDLGWIVSGYAPEEEFCNDMSMVTYCQCYGSDCPYFYEPDLPLRGIDMRFLWSLESIGIVDSPKATREEEAVKFFNETVRYNNGRYEVKWPWIQYPPDLPTNFGLSFGRLRSLLKRADEEMLKDYEEIFSEQLKAGIIELVEPRPIPPDQDSPPVHYLPHHIVKQSGKKGRIVYDASAKIKEEKSLNECMYRGPSLLEDLTALLLKFRTGRVGISADVEKAFLQVGLQEEDRDVTRFLWVKDIHKDLTEDNLMHYRFCRVPFGVIASPFLLTATIRYHLTSNQSLLKKIADRTYVDNLVTGAESWSAAYHLYEETRNVFKDLSMNIRDWISNDKELMERIPQEHRAKETETVKILGLTWNTENDMLKLKLPRYEPKASVTKKEVLRTLARLYDPCGFVSPYILPAKLMFQQTCVLKLKWDSSLPPDLQHSWPNVLENIEAATEVEIPRYVGYNMQEDEVTRQLHCFTDASKNAYAAVVYLVLRGKNEASTAFLMSKSRITPVEDKEDLKIPRLELLGCLIGSRLLRYVGENLDLEIHQKFLWTDSMIVLSWMKTSKLLPPFVSRRVNEIRKNKDLELRYVPTELNPADIATRPDSIHDKKGLWFSGPEFLTKDENAWPKQTSGEEKALFLAEEGLVPEDPEMAGKGYEEIGHIEDIQLHDLEDSNPSVKEIKDLQEKYFPDEVAGKQTSLARNLDLFLDVDGILRCGGRMKNADWSYDTKHPILIPKLCDFTNDVIQRTHEDNYHVGTSHTLSLIRKKYWIPQGRAQVKRILKMCPQCIRHGGGPYQLPTTPALPSERVNYSVPFTFTGIDYFGPIFVKATGRNEKRWVCLFTCLAVRAIHLELVNDLTAEECLLGMRRFVACRGKPSLVVSDNAAQFKLTSEIFMDPQCVKNNIRWKFIPQLAPWHGGVYERLVGVVKNCLKRTLDKHLLQDGQLMTVIKEVEAVVNSRPLTIVTSEVEHILRPADFLTLGNCLELIPSTDMPLEGTSIKIDLLKSWKRGQKILQEFKIMFRDRYLPSLRERYFQRPKQPRVISERSPRVGDVVQIKDDSKNRLNWRVGKISALLRGQDGKYRVAKVKVGEREFTRSIGHLYPLEAQLEEEETNTERKESESRSPIDSSASAPPDTVEIEFPMEHDDTRPEQSLVQDEPMQVDEIPAAVEEPQMGIGEDSMESFDAQPELVEDGLEFRGDSEPSSDAAPSEAPDRRVGRQAAARAREKIAEWTRHLLSIF